MRNIFFTLVLFTTTLAAQKKNIQPSQLPEGALDFIEGNFRNIALHHCFKFTENETSRYKAVMADDTEIEFNEEGQWIAVDGKARPVPSRFLLPAVIEYIKTNYSGERVIKAQKSAKKLEVTLTNGSRLEFDLSGKFIADKR